MTSFSVALIGCGHIGGLGESILLTSAKYTHAAAYTACPETRLVGVCDADFDTASQCASRWDVARVFSSVDDLLHAVNPEIVSIATPDATHGDILDQVLAYPSVRGVLIEKPLALDVAEARLLVGKAHQRGVCVSVNYSRRYAESHQQVKDYIESGALGTIQKVHGYYTKGIIHNGTHWIDLARWFFGDIVRAEARAVGPILMDTDPCLDAIFDFKAGETGYLLGLDARAFSVFEMDIMGTKGRIQLTASGQVIDYFSVKDSAYYRGYLSLKKETTNEDALGETMLNAVQDLVWCLKTGQKPRSSMEDALVALEIASALVQSARMREVSFS